MNKVPGSDRITPVNAVVGVVDLPSNRANMILPANPNTAGQDLEPVKCVSVQQAAEKFEPEKEFQIKKIANVGGEKVEESEATVVMKYGENSKQIMRDFEPENIVVKATDNDGKKLLFEQRLDIHTLDSLLQLLSRDDAKEMVETYREQLVKMLDEEIATVENIKQEIELGKIAGE